MTWLSLEAEGGKQGIVVFDIDDTLFNREKRLPTAAIYKKCSDLGFSCAIITARSNTPGARSFTVDELHKHGITDWEVLHLMPPRKDRRVTGEDIACYKRAKRDEIARKHTIIANIGNMWTDLLSFPLQHRDFDFIWKVPSQSCCILFPPFSHNEVSLKLPDESSLK